jgi:hypothetical protein
VLHADVHIATVEIAHLAGTHVRGAYREPRIAPIDEWEVDNFSERLFERGCRIEFGAIRAQWHERAPKADALGSEKPGMPALKVVQ